AALDGGLRPATRADVERIEAELRELLAVEGAHRGWHPLRPASGCCGPGRVLHAAPTATANAPLPGQPDQAACAISPGSGSGRPGAHPRPARHAPTAWHRSR